MNITLLDLFLVVLVIIHLADGCRHLWRMRASLRWLGQHDDDAPVCNKTTPNNLHLLLPVYEEANVIKSSVEHFEKFAQYPGVQVYYITTEKEGINGATVAVLQELSKFYSFTWLHFPHKDGMKADQLNWAIQQISTEEPDGDDRLIYFGIYDVDSRPEPIVIEAMLYGEEAIYQQPSIYLENYKRIGTFQKVGALFQTKWELCRNVPVLINNHERSRQHYRIGSLPPCTGHGFFIRSDVLQDVYKFRQGEFFYTKTLTEDLELGYHLAFHKVPITLLKAVDFAGYASTYLATISQTSRWFSGELNLYRYYLKQPSPGFFQTLLVLKRYYLTFKWAFGAPLIYFTFCVLLLRYPASIILVFFSLYLYVYEPFKMLYSFPGWSEYLGDKKILYILVVLGSIIPLFGTVGPFHYFLTIPLNKIRGKPRTFVRTPKN